MAGGEGVKHGENLYSMPPMRVTRFKFMLSFVDAVIIKSASGPLDRPRNRSALELWAPIPVLEPWL